MKDRRTLHFGRRLRAPGGFSLMEVMIAGTLFSLTLGTILWSSIGMQHSFQGALYQMDAQSDGSRVLAYISRDLRNSTSVQLNAGGTDVTLTIPLQSSPTLNLNLGLPLLSLLSPPSGSGSSTTTVRYYRQGTSVIRETNGKTTELSSSANSFVVSVSGTVATVDTAFQPQFSWQTASGSSPVCHMSGVVTLLNAGQN